MKTENQHGTASRIQKPDECLVWLLGRASDYIRDADTKNGILLTGYAVMAAVLFSNEWFCGMLSKAIASTDCIRVGAVVIIGALFVGTLACLLASLVPRTRSEQGAESLIYYGGFLRYSSVDEYRRALEDVAEDINDDVLNQVYVNMMIASKKTMWHARSLRLFACLVVVVMVFCVGESLR